MLLLLLPMPLPPLLLRQLFFFLFCFLLFFFLFIHFSFLSICFLLSYIFSHFHSTPGTQWPLLSCLECCTRMSTSFLSNTITFPFPEFALYFILLQTYKQCRQILYFVHYSALSRKKNKQFELTYVFFSPSYVYSSNTFTLCNIFFIYKNVSITLLVCGQDNVSTMENGLHPHPLK